MARVDVDQHEVLSAVVTYLRTSLSLNDRTCYEVLSAADPPILWMGTEDNWQLLVSPGAGQFDAELFHGGGRAQTMEAWQVIVGIYTRIALDETGHDTEALIQANRGILRLKKMVLNSLAGRDLTTAGLASEDQTGEIFLREHIRPVFASQPLYMEPVARGGEESGGPGVVQMLLGFSVPFDWDLD